MSPAMKLIKSTLRFQPRMQFAFSLARTFRAPSTTSAKPVSSSFKAVRDGSTRSQGDTESIHQEEFDAHAITKDAHIAHKVPEKEEETSKLGADVPDDSEKTKSVEWYGSKKGGDWRVEVDHGDVGSASNQGSS